ncbi:MAG: T9SS type A sorting domain-containing protein [Bacteroidia bacterium]|nr:T9SS type A sorting domain-containing protein [Bacteroidia bacterium]
MYQVLKSGAFFLLLFCFSFSSAQVEYFVMIDPDSGTYQKIAQIPNVARVFVNPCYDALNSLDGHFTFRGGPSDTVTSLITLTIQSGSIEYSAPFPTFANPQTQWAEFQYNNSTGKLYALYQNDNTLPLYLTEVNPANASLTIIDSFPDITSVSSCAFTTFNPADGHYIFSGQIGTGVSKLFSIAVSDGNIVYQPDFPPSGGGYFSGFHFHPNEGVLYGLYRNPADSMFLISVNPQTGTFAYKGYIPEVSYIDGDESTLDIINGRYIFKSPVTDINGNTIFRLYSIRLSDAAILTAPEYPHTNDPQDNFIQIRYDNTTNALYALHWDFAVTGISEYDIINLSLYPAPAEKEFTLTLGGNRGEEIRYSIFDLNGKLHAEARLPFRSSFNVNVETLPAGMYFIRGETGNRYFSEIFVKK